MMLSPVPVCMDSTDWSQSMQMQERSFRPGQDHQDLLSCSRPGLDRRLKPQPEQALKCPRCESTNTKFCYYNNYSLSQPRHFCKTCRRYWTKGGALRTVPVGGGCRKNKRTKRTAGDQPAAINGQNEASNNSGTSSAGNGSVITTCTPLDQNRPNNPGSNSTSSMYFNLPSSGSSDINLAFARVQQAARLGSDQSAVGNYNNSSDFLGLSCGSAQSSFGPHSSLNSLSTISSLGNLSALNNFHSLKSGFSSLVDFPISHRTTDQGAQLVLASDWQVPSENPFEQGGDSSSYWTGGPWSDLTSYGSSISPSM